MYNCSVVGNFDGAYLFLQILGEMEELSSWGKGGWEGDSEGNT